MSSHTIVCLAGKRLQVKPSLTSPGMVLVQILSADRAVQASVTVDPAAAGVLSLAFELEGREAERVRAESEGQVVEPEARFERHLRIATAGAAS